MGHAAELDLDAYAELMMALADPEVDRRELLARHGLNEDAWNVIDDAWQERLSSASDLAEDDVVPPFVQAYADAFARAQAARAEAHPVVSFEKFADAVRRMQANPDMGAVLKASGLTIAEFLRANQYWTKRIVDDEELTERFQKIVK